MPVDREPLPPIVPAAFIRTNLSVQPVPTIPEIQLYQAGPASGLSRLGGRPPYWSRPWAGGLALARYILDEPQLVAGRRVLDIGAGSGLVAIAAAMAGAATVTAADIDPVALAALAANADLNGVSVEIANGDLMGAAPPPVDVILVGDLFYERRLARRLTRFLDRCLDADAFILVGDVGRAHLPKARLRPLAAYPVADFGEEKKAGVFSFEREAFSAVPAG